MKFVGIVSLCPLEKCGATISGDFSGCFVKSSKYVRCENYMKPHMQGWRLNCLNRRHWQRAFHAGSSRHPGKGAFTEGATGGVAWQPVPAQLSSNLLKHPSLLIKNAFI